jgi:non-ribosomal peptide synthase protein (TIGR01720 family)
MRLDPGAVDWAELTSGGATAGNAIKAVKEQLRAVPDNGIGYWMLRHLNPRTAPALAALPRPGVGFRYLGRWNTSAGPDWPVLAGPVELSDVDNPRLRAAHALELSAAVLDGPDGPRLIASLTWQRHRYDEHALRELADDWFRALAAIAAHTGDAGGHTPSDLALVALDQDEIDLLEADGRLSS